MPRPQSPIPSTTSGNFDPFGNQPSEAAWTPVADPGSGNGTPSETMSRHSALSAFAESLKQPALAGDAEGELSSPLSAGTPQEPVPRPHHHQHHHLKTLRRHRRSTSEPVPLENVSLVE